jgi:protein kinase A
VIREKNIMASLEHPFVVDLSLRFRTSTVSTCLSRLRGGELFSSFTETRDGIPNGNSFYAACILESLAHLHHRATVI